VFSFGSDQAFRAGVEERLETGLAGKAEFAGRISAPGFQSDVRPG
jgi:hypothetical protein